jgi:cell division cycle 2-like protein
MQTSNLLYDRGILKICDFGLARQYGSPLTDYTVPVVTLYYRSIELLLGTRRYSTPADVWSVGCIFGEHCAAPPHRTAPPHCAPALRAHVSPV